MLRIKKKNTRGNAKNFVTRTQAVKKLQISLADFRRLCIFKGIYPREPRNKKKANKGSTLPVTFYYSKDIQYLQHEPILAKFREHKTFSKKLTKLLGKGEIHSAKLLETNKPQYKLDHVIKERYPTFMDAVRDIDDALNMLFLFSNLPATDAISAKVTKEADILCNRWLMYVARERLIKKVFVSIKGVYYSANVKNQEVIWLVPFKLPHQIPNDIDFRIMLTFLEFYSNLINFVLFKLYNDSNLEYPPKYDNNVLKKVGGLSSLIVESKEHKIMELAANTDEQIKETKLSQAEISKALKADKQSDDSVEQDQDVLDVKDVELDEFQDNSKHTGDLLKQPSKYDNPVSELFSNKVFYIGREVPLDILEFLILSCGGVVIPEILLDESNNTKYDLTKVTHQISDRPKINNKVPGRTYIQPQWIFDSINKQTLLPVSDYAPGETLPPHLSPWGDAVGYDPEEDINLVEEEDDEEEALSGSDKEEEEEEVDEGLQSQKELELEIKGVKFSDIDNNKVKKVKTSTVDEEKELAKIMMSNKQKKLYKKMQYGIETKQDKIDLLRRKKRNLILKRLQIN